MSECWKFQVEGRVQGVWFRESTRRQAELLGLCGYAINCPDGSVEVLACGTQTRLECIHHLLHFYPASFRIS